MSHPETMKVKPWSADQGDYVLINAADFDPAVHQALDAPAAETSDAAPAATKTTRKARAAAAPAAETSEG